MFVFTPTLVFSLVICNKIGLSGLNILKSLQSSIYMWAYEVLWQLLSVFPFQPPKKQPSASPTSQAEQVSFKN